jgi:dihydrofolate reductase
MTKIYSHMTMSLDGYIADPADQVEELFDWYSAGDVVVKTANEGVSFEVDEASAIVAREWNTNTGALISGRRLFDIAKGWGDHHPTGAPVIVVTHTAPADADRWPKTRFVDSIGAAIDEARRIAGDKDICIASASIAQQALDEGLLDEVCVSLVPVLFGKGKPYFSAHRETHLVLGDPVIVQGHRALHLRYPVHRS